MEQHYDGITRRRFFGMMAAMGAATVGAGLLGGCSSSRNSSASQSSSSSATQSASASSAVRSSASATSASSAAGAEASSAQAAGKALVAAFSWSGNTLTVANRVVESLPQADLFRIEPATPYTTNYDEMLQIAQDEQAAGTLPALAANVQGWENYSTIYLGFPTWWSHLPQIVKSFLAEHDCSGKVIYPFNTHGGSGFASCLSDLSAACPNADVREGLSLLGDNVQSSSAQIDAWVATTV